MESISKCRFPGPIPRRSDLADWLRTQKSVFWVSSLDDSDAIGPETTSDENFFMCFSSKDWRLWGNKSVGLNGENFLAFQPYAQYPLTQPVGVSAIPQENPPSNHENHNLHKWVIILSEG